MLLSIDNVGQYGVIKDLPPSELPLGAWTDALNVNFQDGSVQKARGHTLLRTPAVAPYALFSLPSPSLNLWAYCALTKVYGFTGASAADITRLAGDYTGTAGDLWTGGMFQGVPYLNNEVDVPQIWGPPPALATRLVNLTNWPASTTARIMGALKQFMVALDVTKTGVRYPRMVKWSHSAAPGTVPTSWDPTDATKDAGETVLAEGEDADGIVSFLPLGDVAVVYTRAQTWAMQFIGGASVMGFKKIFNFGSLTRNAVAKFERSHFVVTHNDVIVHDLGSLQSVATQRVRDWLLSAISSSSYYITSVIVKSRNAEIWICFPYSTGAMDRAAIWNWKFNTWTFRELPSIRAIASSLNPPSSAADDTFDGGSSGPFSTWPGPFNASVEPAVQESVLMSPADLTGIQQLDSSLTFNGANYYSYVARQGLSPRGTMPDGKVYSDGGERRALVTSIWPRIEAPAGTAFQVYLGSQSDINDGVSWSDPSTFLVGSEVKTDIYKEGRFHAVKFLTNAAVDWKLKGYSLDVVPLGKL